MKSKLNIARLVIIAIVFLYFITRLVNIRIIPIFTDEAIYTYWAQVALNDPANRFISLEDGKQPLFIWIAAIFQNFVNDPLIATRLVSFFSGFGSIIGIYLITKELFSKKAALIASLLYVILPFTLLYDRLALFDSLLTMLGIFTVYLAVKLAKKPRLDLAIINGIAIGLAMITKSSGNFFLYLLPFSLLFFNFRQKMILKNLSKWAGLTIITFIISQVIYNSLRLSPLFYVIERKNFEFIRSVSEILNDPFVFALSNFKALTTWLAIYTSYPLFILLAASIVLGFIKRDLKIIYLSLVIILPFCSEIIFNKVLYPRFALFYYPYVIILIAFFATFLLDSFKKNNKYLATILALFLLIPVYTSFKLLTNPANANIPEGDSNQYFNDWPAGYGVSEIVGIIKQDSQKAPVHVATEGTFGLMPFALNIFFFENENVHISSYWPLDPQNLPREIFDIAETQKTYIVFYQTKKEPVDPIIKIVAKYQQGKGNSFMRLYEISN